MDPTTQEQIFVGWLRQHKGLMLKVVRSFAFRQADRDDLFSGSRNPTVEIDTDIQRAVQSLDLGLRFAPFTATAWARKEDRHREKRVAYDDLPGPDTSDVNDKRLDWLYEQIGRLPLDDRTLCLLMLEGYVVMQRALRRDYLPRKRELQGLPDRFLNPEAI